MVTRWLCIPKLLAAAILCSGLLVFSPDAKAYTDTTPYGLIFASGTVTGDGSAEALRDGQFYYSPAGQKRQVNIAFFRPPSGPATGPWGSGWLPGSVTVNNPDGSVLFSSNNASGFIFFPFWYSATTGLMGQIYFNTTYQGVDAVVAVTVDQWSSGGASSRIQISVYTNLDPVYGYSHCAFYHAGTLTGSAIVDP